MWMYEISLRARVNKEGLLSILSKALTVDPYLIGDEMDFLDRLNSSRPLEVGMKVQWDEAGYQTYLQWSQRTELTDGDLLKLAKLAAETIGTEVAIGDFFERDPSFDLFLIVYPDGRAAKAELIPDSGNFDLKPNSQPMPIADLLMQLEPHRQ